jgi:F420-non-reducing hydrogenase iron-sulfur subunit
MYQGATSTIKEVPMDEFEPKIVAFLCNWCSYAAADLAGTSRLQYPPNTRTVRVMCSGRVNELLILKAFALGADGVLVSGCHPGDCHYMKGNLSARRRVTGLKTFLEAMGISSDRLRLQWVGASEGPKMAESVRDFTETIRKLGPSPLKRS